MKAIITFHSIDNRGTVLSFPPETFAGLVSDLICRGVTICTLDQLLNPEVDNAVAITFDDGMRSVYENALPILRDAKVPAHLYLTTAFVGGKNDWPTQPVSAPAFDMMTWTEIEACVAAGMRIEGHTASHPNLCQLNESQIADECETADHSIGQKIGVRPRHFAYPYGAYNGKVIDVVGNRYQSCTTTRLLPLTRTLKLDELPRLDSYYLQSRHIHSDLFSLSSTAYLRLRHYMRLLKAAL